MVLSDKNDKKEKEDRQQSVSQERKIRIQAPAQKKIAKKIEQKRMEQRIEKIEKNIEDQAEIKDGLVTISKETDFAQDTNKSGSSDTKTLLIVLGIFFGIAVLLLGSAKLYGHLNTAAVVNVDDLHQENIAGELDDDEGYVYNGFSFVKADGLWWTELNKFGTLLKVPLHFGPHDLQDIAISGTFDPRFNEGDDVYIAIDPDAQDKYYSLAISELSFNVVKGMDRFPVGSCTKEHWACDNRTTISCENNPLHKPVVELRLANETKIELQGTCILVQGSQYGIVQAMDRIIYQWYGVMK